MPFVRLARDWRKRRLLLRLFSAKFAPTSTFEEAATETEVVNGRSAQAFYPDAPGIWQLTDESGAQFTVRIKNQNGQLYANVGSVAVPVQGLSGKWAIIE
jgi:hypothetical protein